MTDGVEIVAGTYEEFLVGYRVKNVDGEIELSHSFATHAHTGSVKCVASSGRYLLSGGADDKVVVHDMKTRCENTVLMHHDGTVNSIACSADGSHALSGGADGSVYALRLGNWQVEKHWPKAHKGSPVTYISIHPSNKLALTVGEDHALRTWNLVKGRLAYATNLKAKGASNPLGIFWSPEGVQFALAGYAQVSVWSVRNAAVKKQLDCPGKSTCLAWITEKVLAVGLENGQIVLFDLDSQESKAFDAHEQRVKGIIYREKYLYTASSGGDIKVWKYNAKKMKLAQKAAANTDCRITCLALVDPMYAVKKEKTDEADEERVLASDGSETTVDKSNRKRKGQENGSAGRDGPEKKRPSLKPFVSVTVENDDEEDAPKVKNKAKNKKKNKKKLKS